MEDGFPEQYHLFRSRRLGEVADFMRGIVHVTIDTIIHRHSAPTPSEHFKPLEGVQKKAAEGFVGKLDLQDATPETAAEAEARERSRADHPSTGEGYSDEAWEKPHGW